MMEADTKMIRNGNINILFILAHKWTSILIDFLVFNITRESRTRLDFKQGLKGHLSSSSGLGQVLVRSDSVLIL